MNASSFENLGVFNAINSVQRDIISAGGVSKNQRNHQQKYAFRGIDDMYNTLSPLLARHGLVIMPTVMDRVVVEKPSRNGGCLFYVTVKVKYTFISAKDGSHYDVIVYGEAMDSGDKATNKAMSAAYKYMAIQSFAIPTEGDNDADFTTHQPQYNQQDHYDAGGHHYDHQQPTNYQHQQQPSSDPAMTPAQVKIIQKALNSAGIQQEALLKKVGIARIGELNDSHFQRTLVWIENVKNQRNQRENYQHQQHHEQEYNGYANDYVHSH